MIPTIAPVSKNERVHFNLWRACAVLNDIEQPLKHAAVRANLQILFVRLPQA